MQLIDLVKESRKVYFDHYRQGHFYYNVHYTDLNPLESMGVPDTYQFAIPIEETDGATFLHEDKALVYMRWIRRAFNTGTLIKL